MSNCFEFPGNTLEGEQRVSIADVSDWIPPLSQLMRDAASVAGERVSVEMVEEPDGTFRCSITGQVTGATCWVRPRCATPEDAARASLAAWKEEE